MRIEDTKAYNPIAKRVFATEQGRKLFTKINSAHEPSMANNYIALVKADMQLLA